MSLSCLLERDKYLSLFKVPDHFKDCKPVDNICQMQHFVQGVIDFPWIVEQLEASGYEGDYSLEFELHNVKPESGIKQFRRDFAALFDSRI